MAKKKKKNMCSMDACGKDGALYALGFVGALVYYVMHSSGFWGVVLGILKAIVWPAVLVYSLMKNLGM